MTVDDNFMMNKILSDKNFFAHRENLSEFS